MRMIFVCAASVALLAPVGARAQALSDTAVKAAVDAEKEKVTDRPATEEIDTSIPETPGFAVIDLTPTTVIDPSALRAKSIDLASYIDENGDLKPGLAIAGAPYFWFNHQKLSEYREAVKDNWALGAWARTSLSLGYAQTDEGKADRVGLGFATELLGAQKINGEIVYADPRLDTKLSDCIGDAFEATIEKQVPTSGMFRPTAEQEWENSGATWGDDPRLIQLDTPLPTDLAHGEGGRGDPKELARRAWVKERTEELLHKAINALKVKIAADLAATGMPEAVQVCRNEAAERYARRASLMVAGGMAFKVNPKAGEDAGDGGSAWLSYRRPIGILASTGAPPNYFTLFGRYDFDRKVDPADSLQTFDKLSLALVVGYEWRGSDPKSGTGAGKFALQAGYEQLDYKGVGPLKDGGSSFYAASLDYQVAKNYWLVVRGGAGATDLAGGNSRDNKVTFSVRHSFGQP